MVLMLCLLTIRSYDDDDDEKVISWPILIFMTFAGL